MPYLIATKVIVIRGITIMRQHNLKTKKYCCCIHWNFDNNCCLNKLQLNNFVAMYYFLEFLSTHFHYNVVWNLVNARYHRYLQIFYSWKDKRPYSPKCPPLGKLLIWQTFWRFWLDFWIFNHSLKPPSITNNLIYLVILTDVITRFML